MSSSEVAQGEPLTVSAVISGHKSAKPTQNQFMQGKIKAVYTGVVSETQIINFKTKSSTILNFTIVYNVPGNYKIPPIAIEVDGSRYQIPDQFFNITKEKYQSAPSMIQKFFSLPTMEENSDEKGKVEVKFHTSKSKVFLGEPIIGYFIFYHTQIKNPFFERNPNESISFPFFSSELLSGVKINYPNVVALVKNGISQNYFTNPYNREIFALTPLKEGTYRLGKTKFDYSNSQQIHFFTESVDTIPKEILVLPLPANPPRSFTGEVGEFEVSTKINGTEIQKGNIFRFSILIEGKGLCNRLTDPLLKFIPKSFPGKIESLKVERNKKFAEIKKDEYGFQCSAEFFYSLILEKDSKPFQVAISYFNPETESYTTKEISIPGLTLTKTNDILSQKNSSQEFDFSNSESSLNWKSIIIYFLVISLLSIVIYKFSIRRKKNFILNSKYLDEIQKICGQKTGILLEKALLAKGRTQEEAKFWKDIRKKYFDKEIANIFSILEPREKEILAKFIHTGEKE